jgi:hypothetical protein
MANATFEGHLSVSLNDIIDNPNPFIKNGKLEFDESVLIPGQRNSSENHLSFFPTVLAYISTIIGGGVVGIPYAFYYCGIPLAITISIAIAGFTIYSSYLYLLAKDMTGGHQ